MSSIAFATRASRRPSSRRSGGRTRRPDAERRARAAERPGDDEEIARLRTGTPGNALRSPESRDAEQHRLRARRVAAAHRNTRLVQSFVQLDDVGDVRLARQPERDDQRERIGAAGGEIAEVDRRSAKAEIAPREEIETKVHALDERVLRHDEPVDLRGVVLDALREPAPLELGEQAELARLVEPHSSSIRTRPSSVSGSSA